MNRCFVVLIFTIAFYLSSFGVSNLLTSIDTWQGDSDKYKINSSQLELGAIVAGESFVSKLVMLKDTVLWKLSFEYDFSPSGSNQFRLYFMSNSMVDSTITEALYVEVGESGSEDGINLYQVKSGKTSLIVKLFPSKFTDAAIMHHLVLKKMSDDFALFVDDNLEYKFAVSLHPSLQVQCHVAVYNKFTKSNISGFRIRNFHFGSEIFKDLKVEYLNCDHSKNQLKIIFDQSLLGLVLNSVGVTSLQQNFSHEIKNDTVFINFGNAFSSEKLLQLKLNFSDLVHNPVLVHCEFWYYKMDPFDVVFTEIMYDQEANTGYLQEGQYVELYNRSSHPVDLQKLQLNLDGDLVFLPRFELLSGEYVVLMKDSVSSQQYLNVLPVNDWRALSVASGEIALYSNDDLIDNVQYDKNTMEDSFKQDGGWSVELVSLHSFCTVDDSWFFSEDKIGGTPGRVNSIETTIEKNKMRIETLHFENDSQITIQFTKKLSKLSVDESHVVSDLEIDTIVQDPSLGNAFTIHFARKMKKEQVYSIVFSGITSCTGTPSENQLIGRFGIPETVSPADVIINEILSDGHSSEEDYIEIYNNSTKIVDLSEMLIGIFDDESVLNDTYKIALKSTLLLPFSYLCLTKNAAMVFNRFNLDPERDSLPILTLKNMPNLPAEEGNVGLVNKSGELIDFTPYQAAWHSDLLADTKGVSLERISFDGESDLGSNWTSAVFDVNFGTPGYPNSNSTDGILVVEGKNNFFLNEEYIDRKNLSAGSGLNLHYKDLKGGYVLRGALFRADGVEIHTFCESVLLGSTGRLFFDVNDFSKVLTNSSMYFVLFEAIHPEYKKIKLKQSVSVI